MEPAPKIEAAAMPPKWSQVLSPYVRIARPDHWFKNIFMVPGVVFALFDSPALASLHMAGDLFLGLLSTCLVTSSNYTINELLDAPMDAVHPVKRSRPVPAGLIKPAWACLQWLLLGGAGLLIGYRINPFFFASLTTLLIMGLLYNVAPVRLKDRPYLDVLSESVNNPLRLLLGWATINAVHPPTLSLILAYWMIGAFFMAVKRFAEYRRIGDPQLAARYRRSFSHYNEYRLILSIVYYASAFGLFFGIFMIRYRIELVLCTPFLAGFIPLYMRMGFWQDSPAQYPEQLYKQKSLVAYTAFCVLLVTALLFVDLPFLSDFFQPWHMPGQ
jgi:decaprenyl-phosphate phosphoribosyltransferase